MKRLVLLYVVLTAPSMCLVVCVVLCRLVPVVRIWWACQERNMPAARGSLGSSGDSVSVVCRVWVESRFSFESAVSCKPQEPSQRAKYQVRLEHVFRAREKGLFCTVPEGNMVLALSLALSEIKTKDKSTLYLEEGKEGGCRED